MTNLIQKPRNLQMSTLMLIWHSCGYKMLAMCRSYSKL